MEDFLYLQTQFEKYENKEKAVQMAAYMRNQFPFYGISAAIRKSLYADLLKQEKKQKEITWLLLDKCYEAPQREFQYFVMDYLIFMKNFLSFNDVSKLEQYIRTKPWWDTIDALHRVIGNIALRDSRINDLMLEWSVNENMWIRRIAIDHQLGRKEKTDTELLEQIILNNLGSKEFFINKAIGWSLRDYSKTNPQWVQNFINIHKDQLNNLIIREASKYL